MNSGRVFNRTLLGVTAQLALILLAVYLFRVEEDRQLLTIIPLVFFGFILHALLPQRLRLPFFLFLSMSAILLVAGVFHGILLIGLGALLIAICHFPIPFAARVLILLAAGFLLAALRVEWIQAAWAPLLLPVLASMFMFRLIIYMYDLRHEKKPVSIWERLSYFFMLPNVCFPLFPVVDYQTYRRTYYDRDPLEIYQKGADWMFRGVTHLLLYRLIYYHWVLSPTEVHHWSQAVQYVLATYLLYLRISGQFHLIVGILCLFGFNLLETHHRYLLASSFTDYWRRINIYWKDFMMKLFYYPILMNCRKWGVKPAMILATVVVFVATWLLHSYQWFWLRGSFSILLVDGIFWGTLGCLVVVNALREEREGKKKVLTQRNWRFGEALLSSVKVIGMLVFICALWSLWSSTSVGEWLLVVMVMGNATMATFGWLAAAFLGFTAAGVGIHYASNRWSSSWNRPGMQFLRSSSITTVGSILLILIGTPHVRNLLGERASTLMASLQTDRLNARDEQMIHGGYYEGLLQEGKFSSKVWEARLQASLLWEDLRSSGAVRESRGLALYELIPSHAVVFKRSTLRTNRWGMRDQEYTLHKPPGTYRIALLGASYEMGSGVEQHQTFEAVLEDRLNREHAGKRYSRYEILNFAVGGYSVIPNVEVFEKKVTSFAPDALFLTAHSGDSGRAVLLLSELIAKGVSLPAALEEIKQRAGVKSGMEELEIRRLIQQHSYRRDLLKWSYRRIVEESHKRGIVPVWIFVPRTTGEIVFGETADYLLELAQQAGFVTLDLSGAYGEAAISSIKIAPWDEHPNARGQELLADRLSELLRANDSVLGLGFSDPHRAHVDRRLNFFTDK